MERIKMGCLNCNVFWMYNIPKRILRKELIKAANEKGYYYVYNNGGIRLLNCPKCRSPEFVLKNQEMMEINKLRELSDVDIGKTIAYHKQQVEILEHRVKVIDIVLV